MNAQQQTLVADLLHHEDLQDRLSAVVERTRHSPRLPPTERSVGNRVQGCSSNVWLLPEITEGRCYFRSDADSPVVHGLIALLADYHSGSTPAEILRNTTDPIELLDLKRGLSPTRRHGLAAVSAAIRNFAHAHLPATR